MTHDARDDDEDLHAQAALAEAQAAAGAGLATHVLGPRHRVFLPQSRGDRIRGFWWYIVRRVLFRWSPMNATGWRNLLRRIFGARIAGGVAVASTAVIEYPWNLTLERGVEVSADGVLKSEDGRYYKVTGIPPANRMANEIKVFAVYADDAQLAITGEP